MSLNEFISLHSAIDRTNIDDRNIYYEFDGNFYIDERFCEFLKFK